MQRTAPTYVFRKARPDSNAAPAPTRGDAPSSQALNSGRRNGRRDASSRVEGDARRERRFDVPRDPRGGERRRDERPSDRTGDRADRAGDRRPDRRPHPQLGRPGASAARPGAPAPRGAAPAPRAAAPAARTAVPAPAGFGLDTPADLGIAPAESFADLPLRQEIRAAIDAMGITVPTPIQSQAVPVMLAGHDVVGQARTGSGKTLAFGVPTVERCDPAARGVQALILVPTRELAIQVGDVLGKLAAARRLKLTLLYGGRSLLPESRALAGGAQIVVGTPGRTLDHLRQGNLSLQQLRIFVLDEGDEMLDRGFAPDVERILGYAAKERQTALFSATVAAWVLDTASRHMRTPVLVQVGQDEPPPDIEHVVYDVDPTVRSRALRTLLDRRADGPIIVFGRTKHGVKKLARQLETEGFPVVALHGNLSQKARERAMADLRSGTLPILLATNVAARGLDIDAVSQVINYEVPESAALFTHRVGRTARMGRSGEAITFVTPDDATKWRQIERALGKSLPRRRWDDGDAPAAAPVPVPAEPVAVAGRQARAPQAPAHPTVDLGSGSDAPRRSRRRWRGPRSGPSAR